MTWPFLGVALYTQWRDWRLSDEEWERLKDPATNLVEKHIPGNWVSRIETTSDVADLAIGLFEIATERRMRYKEAKRLAERQADDIIYSQRRNGAASGPWTVFDGDPATPSGFRQG